MNFINHSTNSPYINYIDFSNDLKEYWNTQAKKDEKWKGEEPGRKG